MAVMKIAYDVTLPRSGLKSLGTFCRGLLDVDGHYTDSHRVEYYNAGPVVFRVFIPDGQQKFFESFTGLTLTNPPQVQGQ